MAVLWPLPALVTAEPLQRLAQTQPPDDTAPSGSSIREAGTFELAEPQPSVTTASRSSAGQGAVATATDALHSGPGDGRDVVVPPDPINAAGVARPPLMSEDKFRLAMRHSVDPLAIVESAGKAAIYEATGFRRTYGVGVAGYSKQVAASMANGTLRKMFGDFVFASLFRIDPRHMPERRGSVGHRFGHALGGVVIAHRDSGESTFNSALILGAATAASVANAYYPRHDRTLRKTAGTTAWFLVGKAGGNLLQEFLPGVYRRLRGAPDYNR